MKGGKNAAPFFKGRTEGFFVLGLACVMLLCLLPAKSLFAGQAGGLECENPVFDFGIAGPDDEITHVFWLFNNSDKPVAITRIVAPCEAAIEQKPEKAIEPGAVVPLGLRIRAEDRPGHFVRRIHIYSSSKTNNELALEITGQVKTGIVLMPGSIILKTGNAATDRSSGSSLAVSLDAEELFLHRVSTQVDWLSVSFKEEDFRGRRAYRVFVRLGPDAPAGRFMETITLHTGSQSRPRLDLVVLGEVSKAVQP
jgi:hypothetical protein